ncbi:unnamed protein product, partial [Closterium sp. NIES-54]
MSSSTHLLSSAARSPALSTLCGRMRCICCAPSALSAAPRLSPSLSAAPSPSARKTTRSSAHSLRSAFLPPTLGFPRSLGGARVNFPTLPAGATAGRARRLAVEARGKKKGAEEGGAEQEGGKYKGTVCLPQTSFGMRANASVREPEIQALWGELDVAGKLLESNPGEPFTLHDGPPYANGDLHIGHALNKILKDFINRYQMLRGRKVKFVPGWDCHGLPIELKVLQSMDSKARQGLTPIKLRKKAAQFALKTVDKQRQAFRRYGVWADWEHPYLTLRPAYEAAQLGVFARMVLNGHIYRGRKPVHWSPSSRTALAEAELEYPDVHVSRSIYTTFPLRSLASSLPASLTPLLPSLALAIWTTTPWTIPGNAAVAVNERISYSLVEIGPPAAVADADSAASAGAAAAGSAADGDAAAAAAPAPTFGKGKRNTGSLLSSLSSAAPSSAAPPTTRHVIVATDLIQSLQATWRCSLTPVATFPGSHLEGSTYQHPLDGRICPVVVGGEYITTESGTGLVHTAPGHGQEDYATGLKYGLELISPVDDEGRFTAEAKGGEFEGLSVLGEGNAAVMAALNGNGALLLEEAYEHKYPYDWRSKQPTIFRATDQWFASVNGFKEEALEAIRGVQWFPPQGEKRITAMVEGRSDWCISRQRSWGVPIPAFYHIETGEPLLTQETIAHVQAIVAEKGSDAWWEMEVADLLPPSLRDQAPQYRKGSDTMDVWFDSGSSWASVLASCPSPSPSTSASASASGSDTNGAASSSSSDSGLNFPADLYLEGSDQHRGWFQSSLLTGVAAAGTAPYRAVLTHGFVLDERGMKMSKSVGNVVDPLTVINGGKNQKTEPAYGADVLRLWVASVDYSGDVVIGPTIVKQMSDVYRKLRGTLRFLLGNLHDYEPSEAVPYASLPALDRYALRRLADVMQDVQQSYDDFQFYRFYQLIQRFAVVDLSNFYFDVCKDRLYVGGQDYLTRRACQTVLAHHLTAFLAAIAPVLPHMAEDAWQNLPSNFPRPVPSVFQMPWPKPEADWLSFGEAELVTWGTLIELRSEVNKVMERARMGKLIGANLDAAVYLHTPSPSLSSALLALSDSSASSSTAAATDDTAAAEEGREGSGQKGMKELRAVDSLRTVFLSSQVHVLPSEADLASLGLEFSSDVEVQWNGEAARVLVAVGRAAGGKCERCWNFSQAVGSFAGHPTLCARCHSVVADLLIALPASRTSRPAAARASRSAAPRVTPYCSPHIAPCCPACRALLQTACRALLQPVRRALLPCALRPATASALRPTAASASRSAAPRVAPCCSQHVGWRGSAGLGGAAGQGRACRGLQGRARGGQGSKSLSVQGSATRGLQGASRSTAAAGRGAAGSAGSAAGAGGAGGASGSAGGVAGAGGAGPTTERHCLSWPLSRQLQRLGLDSSGHCLSRTTPPLSSFASGFFSERQSQQETFSPQVLSELFPQRCVTGSVEATALGARESYVALGASESAAALGASESAAALSAHASPATGSSSAEALHAFTLDSGASRYFFRDYTTLTPLAAPVPVSLADPTGGPIVARASTVLPYPVVPSGSLSSLHLPTFLTNLVSNAAIWDVWIDIFIPGGQRVAICICSRTGRHLATFTRQPGSSLYTLTTASAQVAEAGQTLLWHHRLGHPSLPRIHSMRSRLLVSGLPRSLPSLPRSPAPPCLLCVQGRQRAAPHSSEFPPTTAPLQTLHMD